MIFSSGGYMKKIKFKLALVMNFILLSIIYLVGIGLTSIVAKIFGKSFLFSKNKKQSNFSLFKKTTDLERMF